MAIGADPDRKAPLRPGHVIEEQWIDVAIARQDRAFAVMERIGEINRARLLPLIERIFDEFDRPGEVIRIERLELDLGRFGEGEFGDIEERLAERLREALRKAIPPPSRLSGALQVVGETATVRSVAQALLESFEHWLLRGTWPYGTGLGLGTAPADLLAQLLDEAPEALAAMLRRRGEDEGVPRRLARQLPDPMLARLLGRLEPERAPWVLDYMAGTRAAHAAAPLVEEGPEEFGRSLWLIVLRDALHQAGLRSNRRAFVARLVGDIAASAGLSASDLVVQLRAGLAAAPAEALGDGSLLSILAEIGPGAEAEAPDFYRLERLLAGDGARPGEAAELLEAARLSHPEETGWLLRRLVGEDPALLRRLRAILPQSCLQIALPGEVEAEGGRKAPAGARGEAEPAAGEMARVAALLGDSAAGDPRTLAAALDAARAADPVGLRRLLRRFAIADSGRLLGRLLPAVAADAVPELLLAPPLAAPAAALIRAARCSAEERAELLARAAALPPTAPAALLVLRLAETLARRRGRSPEAVLNELQDEAIRAGGEARRALTPPLEQALRPPGEAAERLARRQRAIDWLSDVLHRQGAGGGFAHAAGPALLARLGGTAPEALSAELQGTRLREADAAKALGRLGPASLLRLIALLASNEGEGRRKLRTRLAETHDPAALAALAAELLVAGRVSAAASPGTGGLARAPALAAAEAAALALAFDEDGAPPSTRAARRALALRPPGEAAERLARRQRAIDWLGDLLHRQGAGGGFGHAAGPALLARLEGTAPEALRAELGGAELREADAAKALGRLGPASLLRLLALLAPKAGEGRRKLRARLAEARDPAALAALAAELLVAGRVSAATSLTRGLVRAPALTAAEAAAFALAYGEGGAPPSTQAARRALALLIRRRPFDLLRRLAERGSVAERGLLGDPLLARLLFARLPEARRREAESLARLLTGPGARGRLHPDTLIRSLAAAASAAMRSSSGDFAGHWRSALTAAASPGEGRILSSLLSPTPPAPPPPNEEPGSPAWLLATLRRPQAERQRLLRTALRTEAVRRRLARRLPPHLLARLLAALRPHEAQPLLAAGAILRDSIRAGGGGLSPEALWEAQLAAALAPDGAAVARLLDLLLPAGSAKAVLARAAAAARGPLAAAFEERAAAPARRPPPSPDEPRRRPAAEAEGGAIAVLNAGLVLTSPFLPQLFTALELVARDSAGKLAWREPERAGRAVHILQYLVDGRCDSPEPLLALNKLLCGLDPSWPALPGIVMAEAERMTCESMLAAMIANWPMLSGSSPAALQETFLRREGRITRGEDGWKLEVERKVLDVLVDAVPWGFSMIFHSWMEEPLRVSW